MMCCGKDRNENFCSICGKPMNKQAGLRGLLRYVEAELKKATTRVDGAKREYDRWTAYNPGNTGYSDTRIRADTETARKKWESAKKKAAQWQDWQESLIKAIDGE